MLLLQTGYRLVSPSASEATTACPSLPWDPYEKLKTKGDVAQRVPAPSLGKLGYQELRGCLPACTGPTDDTLEVLT